jgi:D-lactate dehydrogenase (cytochrome)
MDLLSELRNILPDEESVRADGEEVERHGGGMFTYHDPRPPDAVVYPRNRDEVAEVLRFASEHGLPVVPFGQGSSLEGQTIPKEGGISLDLALMDEILEARPDDFLARVQPVDTHAGLNTRLREHLKEEHGDSLPFMRAIKRLADPKGVLNPGNLFLD